MARKINNSLRSSEAKESQIAEKPFHCALLEEECREMELS